jgi:hypothetical protein
VIPKEGVERKDVHASAVVEWAPVIPKEGVESQMLLDHITDSGLVK